MSTKGKRPLLSAHEKVEAIRRVHDGESKASVARDIGVPESTLRGWCKNEDKILYLSRQSTPETSESEPELKKSKYDYQNLSTPLSSASIALNFSISTSTPSTTMIPDNLTNLTSDVSKMSPGFDPKYNLLTTAKTPLMSHEKRELSKRTLAERQRTRAELDRLSAELGLNRPEFGLLNVGTTKQDQGLNMSMLATSPLTNINHMSGGTSHTPANLGTSFQEIAAKVWNQVNQNAAVAAAAATLAQNPLLNNKMTTKKPNLDTNVGLNLIQKDNTQKKQMPTSSNLTDDSSMWFWLRAQQEMLNLAQNTQKLTQQSSPSNTQPTSTSPFNPNDLKNSSWFWKWYKQYYGFLPNLQNLQQSNIDSTTSNPNSMPLNHENNILLQQLTKNSHSNNYLNTSQFTSQMETNNFKAETEMQAEIPEMSFNQDTREPNSPIENSLIEQQNSPIKLKRESNSPIKEDSGISKNPTKVRAVLDNLLTNNNNMQNRLKQETNQEVKENEIEAPVTLSEAIEYGQKFLKWLEDCSDPAVTAMQVIQFRFLLNNLKTSADRRNHVQNGEKINRRK